MSIHKMLWLLISTVGFVMMTTFGLILFGTTIAECIRATVYFSETYHLVLPSMNLPSFLIVMVLFGAGLLMYSVASRRV